jgi:Protein kinase domain
MDLTVGSVFAGHRLDAVAGRGGMGVVYRATDLTLDRVVALKVITPELASEPGFAERFKRESRVAASLTHPHVLPIYRAGEEDGRLFITMQFVEGPDLGARLATQGAMPPVEATRVIGQIASALDAAHAKGLVHRDVKPANVILAQGSGGLHAYLTDFGLTKATDAASALTATGMLVGTVDYMAPEQLMGQTLDARTDVYALACVLFETLTGRVPYPVDTPVAKMHAHANQPAPSLREAAPALPPGLEAVIARGMAKDPAERYATTGELGRAAEAAAGAAPPPPPTAAAVPPGPTRLEPPSPPPTPVPWGPPPPPPAGPPIGGPPPPPWEQPPPRKKGKRGLVVALVLAAVLVAGGGVTAFALTRGGDDGGGDSSGFSDSADTDTSGTDTDTTETDTGGSGSGLLPAPGSPTGDFAEASKAIRKCLRRNEGEVLSDPDSGYVLAELDPTDTSLVYVTYWFNDIGYDKQEKVDKERADGNLVTYADDSLVVTLEGDDRDSYRSVADECTDEVV